MEELDGYKEYMDKVKYRIIPFIWQKMVDII